MLTRLKTLLPDRPTPMRIWRGPFRGAHVVMNPRTSMRKCFGLYEHELNSWLEQALDRVTRVLDVGANDGYFTFGCAAALRRRGVSASVVAFEPDSRHVAALRWALAQQPGLDISVEVVPSMVGKHVSAGTTTLDAWPGADRERTLIKIDVEGAELDVIEGARSWMTPSNLWVIEVHREALLVPLVQRFHVEGLRLDQIDQRPLPILGRESRDAANWWLVSDVFRRA